MIRKMLLKCSFFLFDVPTYNKCLYNIPQCLAGFRRPITAPRDGGVVVARSANLYSYNSVRLDSFPIGNLDVPGNIVVMRMHYL